MSTEILNLLISKGFELSFVVALLLTAVIYLVKRDNWIRVADAKIADRYRQECLDREQALGTRLKELENRQYKDSASVLQSTADALSTNARTFERLIADSNFHRILKDRQ